ncbi:hypothetical protein SPRG_12048 [Saprolegnia parasitica CBS 223.65]|uniref:C2 domain-containing protein n=1 Tax=Saprolegnia parasitica (strain CBS 223.65) TaxID=695850 RepID=A0A067C682_SAPPC|nr:hypothetical protein SPRG_12048 [Saprolegnia parasitica CBS 223.65]KDO22061.1 hypothetical protein SPRG_12048 [Saprolegnia parasitica CBS 223.65]|eukprot:XP_012207205.1 hypothetical protein SPRG_12048 [Saprolegnia parasitica CBS 223.65]
MHESTAPRLLRVQVARVINAPRASFIASLPHKLSVITKLLGDESTEHVTPPLLAGPTTGSVAWAREVYVFELTEADMYNRVLEVTLLESNSFGMRNIVGRARVPLSAYEADRSRVHETKVALEPSNLRILLHMDVWDSGDPHSARRLPNPMQPYMYD